MEPVESSQCKVYDSKTCQVLQKTLEMFLPLIFSKLQKKIAELSQRQNSGASWVNLLDWFSLPSYQVSHTDVEGLVRSSPCFFCQLISGLAVLITGEGRGFSFSEELTSCG